MVYFCKLCNTYFENEWTYTGHVELIHNVKSTLDEHVMEWDDDFQQSNTIDLTSNYLCDECGEMYSDELLLIIHKDLQHCEDRPNNLSSVQLLDTPQNKTTTENRSSYICERCGDTFHDELLLTAHCEIFHIENSFKLSNFDENCITGRETVTPEETSSVDIISEALEGKVVRHYRVRNVNKKEVTVFLNHAQTLVNKILKKELERLNVLKFNLVLESSFNNVENESSQRGFISRSRTLLHTSDIDDVIVECFQEIILKITEHEARGSGWSLSDVHSLHVRVHKQGYGDRGSSYIPLPQKIANTKACINVENTNNECFKYAMLTKFLVNDPHSNRPSKKYDELVNMYNFKGIAYPTSLSDVKKFQRNNIGVSVNVFALDDRNNMFPLQIVPKEQIDHTDLLLLKDGDVAHYVYIKDFNRLVGRQLRNKNRNRLTVCKRCFGYTGKPFNNGGLRWLEEHTRLCGEKHEVKIQLPSNTRKNLVFKNTSQQYRIPIVIYADFEASLLPVPEDEQSEPSETTRQKYQKHHPNSFCLLLKSTLEEDQLQYYGLTSKPITYRGENAAKRFVDELYDIANKVEILYSYIVPMEDLSDQQNLQHLSATTCYICCGPFTEENGKVRDHDHLTGLYRGAACNACNINYKLPKFIPVVLHNLSRYDAHFIVPELARDKNRIDVLATSNENFISFSKRVGKMKLRFIDSYRFLPVSILKLTESLSEHDFIETRKLVPQDKMNLVLRKGVFCYDYIDSFEKFSDTTLPPIDNFYNKLNEEALDPDDYEHACKVWRELEIQTLGEYNDFYVKLDVTLLCDIMQEFRSTCFESYGLDPLHCFTSPGLAWQAMLKETKCNLELITDIDMLLMFESGIRGGITQSITRQVKANHKYLPDYNSNEESVYLGYFDANNLYGWAMSKPLPFGGFEWVNPNDYTIDDILNWEEDGKEGYILEFDVEYPLDLHDHHYDFPLFPLTETPPNGKHKKLMTTVSNKIKYIAHYLVVQQAIKLGLKVTKIHRVIKFSQSCWLKPYIEANTRRRAVAKTKFQKDFCKLMNNAIYGKTLENKREHKNVQLVTDRKKLEKLVCKPNFNTSIIINNNLVAVSMGKTVVKMDRPLFVGMCILDLSKTLMYDFHYNKMVKFYGRDRIGISYTDTDAFVYWIKTEDMYDDLKTFPYSNEFDFSDYPSNHPTYDGGVNKKIIGKFKDETNGRPIREIIALAPKMYAMQLLPLIEEKKNMEDSEFIKKAKGIKQLYVKNKIKFKHYRRCLKRSITYKATYNTIRSFNHQLYSVTETKKSLSPYDDKRYILPDGIHTLPHGHYLLR